MNVRRQHRLVESGIFDQLAERVVQRGLRGVPRAEQIDRDATGGGRVESGAGQGRTANDVAGGGILDGIDGVRQERGDGAVEQGLVVVVLAVFEVRIPAPGRADGAAEAAGDTYRVVIGLVTRRIDRVHVVAQQRSTDRVAARKRSGSAQRRGDGYGRRQRVGAAGLKLRRQVRVVRADLHPGAQRDEDSSGDLEPKGAESAVGEGIGGEAARVVHLQERVQTVADLEIQVREARVALGGGLERRAVVGADAGRAGSLGEPERACAIGIVAGVEHGGPGAGGIKDVLRPGRNAHAQRHAARGQNTCLARIGGRPVGPDDVVRQAVGRNRRARPGGRGPVVERVREQGSVALAPVANLRADTDVLGILILAADDEMGTVPEVIAVT